MVRSSICVGGVSLFLLIASVGRAEEATLGIGSPAPKLEVKKFVKGEPVTQFEKKKIYVVEFWATWCGPCVAAIPHLSELQKKHKDVVFIGVNVWEEDTSTVPPFLKEMGGKMNYRVALDLVPEKGEADDGKMVTNWLAAAKQEGIPATFVVNGDGVIAWIGHPGNLEKPLAKIVAGKWDVAAAAKQQKLREKIVAKIEEFEALDAAKQKPEAMVKFLDEQFAADAELEEEFWIKKLELMFKASNDRTKAAAYAGRMVDTFAANSMIELCMIAGLIDVSGSDSKVLAVALKAAEKADALIESKDAGVAALLAKAYAANGDAAKASVTIKRALTLAKAAANEDKETIEEWTGLLKKYEGEAKKK